MSGKKLKSLKTDLKEQDKEEIVFKRVKGEGGDKDGLKEAELRRKLNAIVKKYNLEKDFPDEKFANSASLAPEEEIAAKGQIFKDKKLDKLWQKALNSGFDDEQLMLLKEEFTHHEEKVKEYNQMIQEYEETHPGSSRDEAENAIHHQLEDEKPDKSSKFKPRSQSLQDKHIEVKKSYEKLKSQVRDRNIRPLDREFEEMNVQKLWDLAKKSDFTSDELASIKEELNHYQTRIKKLKYFQLQFENEQLEGKKLKPGKEESHLERKVKELDQKVNKVHNYIETKIMRRHIEL